MTGHLCGRCPARWSGSNVCHCSACHATFSGLAAFDMHRVGDACTAPSCPDRSGQDRLELDERGIWCGTARTYGPIPPGRDAP